MLNVLQAAVSQLGCRVDYSRVYCFAHHKPLVWCLAEALARAEGR